MVAVVVRGHREGVHRVGAAVRLLRVQPSVAVVVGVAVVADSVAVEVRVLGRIEREGVVDVGCSVAVVVGVDLVAQPIAVVVVGHRVSIQAVGAAGELLRVRPGVAVVVEVGVVADSVAIGVDGLVRVVREGVIDVEHEVVVVVGVGVVADAVAIEVSPLARVPRERVVDVVVAVAVDVSVHRVAYPIEVEVCRYRGHIERIGQAVDLEEVVVHVVVVVEVGVVADPV